MRLPKLDNRGQAEPVILQLTLIITLVVAIIVVYQLFISGAGPTTDQYIAGAASSLTNTDFSENSDNLTTFAWDNAVENAAVNAWDVSGYVTTTVSDNGDVDSDGTGIWENGYFYQALTLTTIGDGVVSATLTADYRLIDNENIEDIDSYVYLCDGTDNTTIWTDNSIENSASWTSISESVLDNVDATGTYTVYLITQIKPDNTTHGSSVIVAWDEVNLSVTAETADNPNYDADALAAFNNVVTLSWAGIGLMAVAIIIIAAAMILSVVRGFGGAGRGV